MPRLLTASEIHQRRVAEGLVDLNPGQGDTRQIGADDPRLGREFWKPPTERPRYLSSKEEHDRQLREKAKHDAERDAQFQREMAPIWAAEKREMELRRQSGYHDWLAELTHSNTELAAVETRLAALNDRLFDTKQRMCEQPRDLSEIVQLASELPALREILPLLEIEIERSEKSLHEWRIYGEGIARKLHADLTQRISEWRTLRIAELRDKFHQEMLTMFGTEPKPVLIQEILQDSAAFKALESPVTLPSEGSMNVDELKASVSAVEGLTSPRERQPETAALDAAEAADELNKPKAATRSKAAHLVSR